MIHVDGSSIIISSEFQSGGVKVLNFEVTHLQANWQTAHQESLQYLQRRIRGVSVATIVRHPTDIFCDSMESSSKKMSYSFS